MDQESFWAGFNLRENNVSLFSGQDTMTLKSSTKLHKVKQLSKLNIIETREKNYTIKEK